MKEKEEKRKTYSKKQLERIERKANKIYQLSECPKCGGEMECHPEHYEDSDMFCYWWCEKCNLGVTHYYGWCNTEITQHKEG